jgi:aspartate carbamoyltransferase catalytic subunit
VLHKSGTPFTETNDVYDALRDPSIDVVYWTRTQKERMPQPDNRIYAQAKHFGGRAIQAVRKWWSDPEPEPQMGFVLNPDTIKDLSVDARIMHPLPRVDEIDTAIDHDLRSIFFPQVKNGLYAREALLDIIAEQNILGLL